MKRFLGIALLGFYSSIAPAAVTPPAVLENTKPIDSRGELLPLDTMVVAHDGQPRALRDWVKQDQPMVLTFNYMGCAMLCSLQQDGLARTLSGLELTAGKDFSVVSVSIDPDETSEMAARASERLSERIDGDWSVVTASEEAIRTLTDSAGFRFEYLKSSDQYAHAALTYVLTPEGRVSQYLSGIEPATRDLNFALIEASDGKIGSFIDQIALACLQYDSTRNSYVTRGVMRAGGVTILAGLGLFLGVLWNRERSRWS